MRHFYLDSSVAVHILFGQSPSAAGWLDHSTGQEDELIVSSRVLRTELTRLLRREAVDVFRRDGILDFVGVLPLHDAILAQAEAIVPHVKTLDAIHLATLVHSGIDAAVVTHDTTMAAIARTLGYDVHDPVGAR